MKAWIVSGCLIAAGSALAEDAAQRGDAMLGLEYADEQGCFIVNDGAALPVLPLLVSSDGLPGIEHDSVIAALDAALARGCDIDQPDLQGLSPLNTAIVQGNVALVKYLLEHGADAGQTIETEVEALNGLDSLGLIDVLSRRAPEQAATWHAMREALQ